LTAELKTRFWYKCLQIHRYMAKWQTVTSTWNLRPRKKAYRNVIIISEFSQIYTIQEKHEVSYPQNTASARRTSDNAMRNTSTERAFQKPSRHTSKCGMNGRRKAALLWRANFSTKLLDKFFLAQSI